jgi:hypothetical protein
MERLEALAPGITREILDMARDQGRHRMELERIAVVGENARANLGPKLGFGLCLAALGVSGYCASIDQPWVAGALGGLDIVSLVAVFVYGTERRRTERLEKIRMLRDL